MITLFCTVRIADLQHKDHLGILKVSVSVSVSLSESLSVFLSVSLSVSLSMSVSQAPVIVDPCHLVAA